MNAPVLGVLVGGASSRMNGFPKGLLPAPTSSGDAGPPLVDAIARAFLAAVPDGRVVLLGSNAEYRVLPYDYLQDDPPKSGPIGGLGPLLRHCAAHDSVGMMTACDLPYLTRTVFQRLLCANPEAIAVAFERNGRVEPLPARFDAHRTLPILEHCLSNRVHSLKGLLEACNALLLDVADEDAYHIQDWDSPEDMEKGFAE